MLESNPLQAPLGLGHYLACRQSRRRKIISFRMEFPPLARKSKRQLVRGYTQALFWLDESFNHCRETYMIFAANSLELQT